MQGQEHALEALAAVKTFLVDAEDRADEERRLVYIRGYLGRWYSGIILPHEAEA